MVLVDGRGLPLAGEIASASPHEVTLIEPLLAARLLRKRSRRLIYDGAADSDPLRARLRRRRWKIERSIGWLQNFRRLVTRYEHYAHLFHGFLQLACLMIVLRRF
jgi:hypothetical protein